MAFSQPRLLLQTVAQLDSELTSTLVHMDVLATSRDVPLEGLRLALSRAVRTMRDVHSLALQTCIAETTEALEVALLARAAAVTTQLASLRAAERSLTSAERVGVPSVRELDALVTGHIGRINSIWLTERRSLHRVVSGDGDIARHSLYELSLRNATWGYVVLGRNPVVMAFLRGAAAADSPCFRAAACVLAKLLEVEVESSIPWTT